MSPSVCYDPFCLRVRLSTLAFLVSLAPALAATTGCTAGDADRPPYLGGFVTHGAGGVAPRDSGAKAGDGESGGSSPQGGVTGAGGAAGGVPALDSGGHDTDGAIASDAPAGEASAPLDADVIPVPAGYPTGPFGRLVGDTIAPLVWEGYVNETATGLARDQSFGEYGMDTLRRSGRPFALLHFADFDCPGCRNGASDLAAQGKSVVDAGGAVVEVLITHAYFSPATRSFLDAWVTTYDLTVTSVIDAPGRELESLERIGIRETTVVVDLSTMKIVWRLTGDLFGIDPSSINAGTAEILARLP